MSQETEVSPTRFCLIFSSIGLAFILFSFIPVFMDLEDNNPSWIIFSVGILACIFSAIVFFSSKKDYSVQEIEHLQKSYDSFWRKWYVRAINSAFMTAVAFFSFQTWLQGANASGVFLLMVNPIFPPIIAVLSLFNAWEVSLAIIVFGMVYLTFIGLSAISVSAAIIVGSIIIAFGIYKTRA
ncbi:hypothetical protein KZZ04_07750 [Pseudoalteromonas sp. CR1]|uniref:hypothetical protein n=1 Tax=Pseudoalteromonas sp. CR1 TaxID=2861964 RepID=UPI001C5F4540|nr:hypothetical protein [Pseudoalteromonas sp. CR1]MBW4966258.1 hypothetical protein [Pseudoalteromonas sp. CR1]